MKNLKNAIEHLSNKDRNGNYNEILNEIQDGQISITDGKLECINILNRWKSEEIEKTDIINLTAITELIKLLQE